MYLKINYLYYLYYQYHLPWRNICCIATLIWCINTGVDAITWIRQGLVNSFLQQHFLRMQSNHEQYVFSLLDFVATIVVSNTKQMKDWNWLLGHLHTSDRSQFFHCFDIAYILHGGWWHPLFCIFHFGLMWVNYFLSVCSWQKCILACISNFYR